MGEKQQIKATKERAVSFLGFFSCVTRGVRPSERASAGAFSVVRPSLAAMLRSSGNYIYRTPAAPAVPVDWADSQSSCSAGSGDLF